MDAHVGTSVASRLAAYAAIACATTWVAAVSTTSACSDGAGGRQGSGGAGGSGTGGAPGCSDEVAPLFTLHVIVAEGELPEDLKLHVSWSAGDEPAVTLGDASSYGTSEDNVVCVRRPAEGPTGAGGDGGDGGGEATTGGEDQGESLDELLCELWTSGPTRVQLDAAGYLSFDETLPPATTEGCDRPVPSDVEIELVIDEPDEE